MKWFRPGPPPHQTALAMIGARTGQRVLMIGAADSGLAAALAGVTGLNGRTLVVDPSPDAQRAIESAAAEAGTLVDFEQRSFSAAAGAGEFDIVVLSQALSVAGEEPAAVVSEAVRAVRTGGRVVAIEGATTPGVFGALRRRPRPSVSGDAMREVLTAAGLRATRILAEVDGATYVEGTKKSVKG